MFKHLKFRFYDRLFSAEADTIGMFKINKTGYNIARFNDSLFPSNKNYHLEIRINVSNDILGIDITTPIPFVLSCA